MQVQGKPTPAHQCQFLSLPVGEAHPQRAALKMHKNGNNHVSISHLHAALAHGYLFSQS